MSIHLCEKCSQLMKRNISADTISFRCSNCGFTIIGSPDDTLLDIVKKESGDTNALVLDSFIYDNTVVRVPYKCEKCDLPFKKMAQVGSNLQIVIRCPRCAIEVRTIGAEMVQNKERESSLTPNG